MWSRETPLESHDWLEAVTSQRVRAQSPQVDSRVMDSRVMDSRHNQPSTKMET